eukprot:4538231-Prymnesium_polylepis.1
MGDRPPLLPNLAPRVPQVMLGDSQPAAGFFAQIERGRILCPFARLHRRAGSTEARPPPRHQIHGHPLEQRELV